MFFPHSLHPISFHLELQAAFAFSLVWSVGGSCDAHSREKFSEFFKATLTGKTDKHPIPEAIGKWECPLADKGLVYDYFYEVPCHKII